MSTAELAPPINLGFDSAGLRMTPEEFDAVDDWDELYRYELVNGIVIVNPIPSEAEADPNELLGALLRIYQRNHPNGKSLDRTLSERYIHFPNHRRRADRVIWAGLGRRPNPKTDVPTIAVEFVSTGKRNAERDYETKRDEYLAIGVQEYWIIDRFKRAMTVQKMAGDGHAHTVVHAGEIYTTELLPGFELPFDELLSAADDWENDE